MGRNVLWRKVILGSLLLCCGLSWASRVTAQVRIAEVRIGFADEQTGVSYGRFGHWLPVRVVVESDSSEQFSGQVTVSTPDADGIVQEVIAEPTLRLSARNKQQVVWAYVQCGHGKLRVQVRDDAQRVVASFVYPDDTGRPGSWQIVPPAVIQVLALGEPAGLGESVTSLATAQDPGYRVCKISWPHYLPDRWYGYDGVQVIVLATGGQTGEVWTAALRARAELAQALREWVQQGGHLVVCAATQAEWLSQREHFPLTDLLPGEWVVGRRTYSELLVGVREVTASRFREPTALATPRCDYAELRKKPGASQRAFASDPLKPAVLVWPYGLGQVSLVAFDTNVGSFRQWEGRTAFWEWLLETEPLPARQTYRTALTTQRETEPLTQLVHQLEQFQNTEVPFALIAGLMLGYLLVAGPLDYLVIVRWLRRPGWAWGTFPLLVGVLSVAVWYSAWVIHGGELAVHELVLYDLEMSSESRGQAKVVRGSGSAWWIVKSPQLRAYSLSLADLENGEAKSSPAMKVGESVRLRESALGWAIRPDDDALQRGQRENLVQSAVRVFPGKGRLENVPLQAWSLKTLFGRWLLDWDVPPRLCEARLMAPDLNTLRGELTWHATWPLLGSELTFGSRVWNLGDLQPGQSVAIQRQDVGLLERRRQLIHRNAGTASVEASSAGAETADSRHGDDAWAYLAVEAVQQLTFQRLLVAGRRQLPNPYLPFLDQSRRLRYRQAVLSGYLPVQRMRIENLRHPAELGPTLVKIEPAIPGQLHRVVFIRLYIPVSTAD